jgi:rare lipoprotein A
MTQEVLGLRSSFRPRAFRVAQLMIALAMLAVPAEAFAFSGIAGSSRIATPAVVPVEVTPREVRLGTPVRIAGRLPVALAGTTVELQTGRSPRGPWRQMRRARVSRRGGFSLQALPRHSTLLRVISLAGPRLSAAPVAVADHLRVPQPPERISRVARIRVRAAMHVARRVRGALAGRPLAITGRLLPARGGRIVSVQRHSGHAWRTLAHGRTGGRGGFAVRFRPGAGAPGELRVVFAGDRANSRAIAAAGMLAVYQPVVVSWYLDGGATACGFHATYGIANRTLPCGTHVRLRRGARAVTATVDDRGPYVYGRQYDLSQATAAALGFAGVGTIQASVQ